MFKTQLQKKNARLDALIETLKGKAVGGGGEPSIQTQEKTVNITENGTTEVLPDEGFALSKVTVNVEVESGGGGGEVNMGTCTINIIPPSSSNYYTSRETVSNGAITYTTSRSYTGSKFAVNARCDSVMYVSASTIKSATTTDGEILNVVSGYGIAFKTPSGNGTTVTITLGA
jgi:hypothetical protein